MERLRVERIAWIVSGSSFLTAAGVLGVHLLGWRPETAFVVYPILVLLLVMILGMVVAITYSEDGWTATGSRAEWVGAFVINPVLAVILFSFREENPEDRRIDLEDHERLSKL